MSKIRDVAERYAPVAQDGVSVSGTLSQIDRTLAWFSYCETYARSAESLSLLGRDLFLPWQQLAGHALECAFRGCLQSAGIKPPVSRDLIWLFEQAESFGFQLCDADLVMIVLVSHAYLSLDAGTPHVQIESNSFGVITQYSQPPSLRLNRAVRGLRSQALKRLDLSSAEA